MTVEKITLRCFRNHRETEILFYNKNNILVGKNGQGKTNILEAISYLCLTKSFFGAHDTTVVMIGESSFSISGTFVNDSGLKTVVQSEFTAPTNERRLTINNKELEKRSDHIGKFPIVILSPEHAAITMGGPAERRKFMDLAIAQTSGVYLEDILEYRKIIRQRNTILSDLKAKRQPAADSLDAWNESFLQRASKIIVRRKKFLNSFAERIVDAYGTLTLVKEQPGIEYIPHRGGSTAEEIQIQLEKELCDKSNDEMRLGMTLVGPHRDDIRFTLNGQEIRKYASQGQHKTFLIALKIAEYELLKELCDETPIILLDDVFSELDDERTERLFGQVSRLGQTFMTTTDEAIFNRWISAGNHATKVEVTNGTASYAFI